MRHSGMMIDSFLQWHRVQSTVSVTRISIFTMFFVQILSLVPCFVPQYTVTFVSNLFLATVNLLLVSMRLYGFVL